MSLLRVARRRAVALGAAAIACGAAWVPGSARSAELLLDGIAAQVGSQIVLISEVSQLAAPIEIRMRQASASEAEIMTMRAEVLERLIEARLIEGVVERLELGASDAEVTNAIEGIAANTGLTLSQLARSVESHGLSLTEYREKIKSEIERSKVLNTMVRTRVRVEPEEVRALYDERFAEQPKGGEEIRVHHLLVAYGAETLRDRDTACRLVEEGRAKIVAGEATFADVARQISDTNREQGGEVGWVHLDDLAGWMAANVDRLETGSVSEIVETSFGCNLLMVSERRGFEPISFAEAEAALTEEVFRRKTEEEYIRWIDRLREQTYIERKGVFAEATRLQGLSSRSAAP